MASFDEMITAARSGSAAFPVERDHIELTGSDRAKFLHNFCTNDILRLTVHNACEAFICNAKGRVLGQIAVVARDESLWLVTVPGAAPKLIAHLDRYLIREDVQFHDRTAEVTSVLITGAPDWPKLPPSLDAGFAAKIAWLPGDPELLTVPQSSFQQLLTDLTAQGTMIGDAAAWESLRIDAGFPEYGVDVTDEQLAQEAGRTEQCICFTKGCYLGQEPIARLDALGHTNRELRRLLIEGDERPQPLTALSDPVTGSDAGVLTSVAPSPAGHGWVALGFVKSKWREPGAALRAGKSTVKVR